MIMKGEKETKRGHRFSNQKFIIGISLIVIVVVLSLFILKQKNTLHWDESAYIAKSMNLIDSDKGFYDSLKPIGLPYAISSLTKAFKKPISNHTMIGIAKTFMILSCICFLFLFASISNLFSKVALNSKKLSQNSTVVSLMILVLCSCFFKNALQILPIIPGFCMIFIAILLLYNERYFLSGIFVMLAIAFDYDFIIYLITINLSILLKIITIMTKKYSINDTIHKFKKKLIFQSFRNIFYLNTALVVTLIFLRIKNISLNFLFLPIQQNKTIPLFASIIKDVPVALLFLVGIIFVFDTTIRILKLIKEKQFDFCSYELNIASINYRYTDIGMNYLILSTLIISTIYFAFYKNIDALHFTIIIAILSAISLIKIINFIRNNITKNNTSFEYVIARYNSWNLTRPKKTKTATFILFLLILLGASTIYSVSDNTIGLLQKNSSVQYTIDIDDSNFLTKTLDDNMIVLSMTPTIIELTDAKIIPDYNDIEDIIVHFENSDVDALLINIALTDNLSDFKKQIIGQTISKHKIVFAKIIHDEEWILITKNKINIDHNLSYNPIDPLITNEYMTSNIRIALTPFNQDIVVFRLDAIGDISTNQSMQNKQAILDIIEIADNNEINFTIAVIPNKFKQIKEKDKQDLVYALNNTDITIEIAQNSIDFENKGFSEQTDLVNDLKNQTIEINKSKEILQNYFGEIKTFIPAYNNGNKNTIKALQNLNFATYSSIESDELEGIYYGDIIRTDIDTFMIDDWVYRRYKTQQNLSSEIKSFVELKGFAVVEMYILNEKQKQSIDLFNKITEELKQDYSFYTLDQLSQWKRCYNNLIMEERNDTYIISLKNNNITDNCSGITLITNQDINIKTINITELYIENINQHNSVKVCNKHCTYIRPGKKEKY